MRRKGRTHPEGSVATSSDLGVRAVARGCRSVSAGRAHCPGMQGRDKAHRCAWRHLGARVGACRDWAQAALPRLTPPSSLPPRLQSLQKYEVFVLLALQNHCILGLLELQSLCILGLLPLQLRLRGRRGSIFSQKSSITISGTHLRRLGGPATVTFHRQWPQHSWGLGPERRKSCSGSLL